jgi:TolB protein
MKNSCLILYFILFAFVAGAQVIPQPVHYANPRWSPDGKSIAFESTREGKSAIYIISADGKELKRVTDTAMAFGQPSWSPDGKNVVYYGNMKPMQIFRNSINGGAQRMLTIPPYEAYQPWWGSNGKIVLNTKFKGQTPNEISVINDDGTGFIKLTDPHYYDCASPQWNADASKILFVRSTAIHKKWKEITDEEMAAKRTSAELVMMNADGTNVQSIFSPGFEPAFTQSTNRKNLYYIDKHDTATVLFILPIETKKPESLLSLQGTIYSISISPDESLLTYAAKRNGKEAIYIMELKTKKERLLIGE